MADYTETIKDCAKGLGKFVVKAVVQAVVVSIFVRVGLDWFASKYCMNMYNGRVTLEKRHYDHMDVPYY
jgi:hypothetical protein